ncbi:MAG: hypothetical protein AAFM92_04610 [Pseudomonadota bacterium]
MAQQVTYIVSALFVGRFSIKGVFGNAAQLALNTIFLSVILYFLFRLTRYLFEKFPGRSASDIIPFPGLVVVIPIILFLQSIRPASIPIEFYYRDCAVRIGGELTSCGFWSAVSDLFAMLLVAALVVVVFKGITQREN